MLGALSLAGAELAATFGSCSFRQIDGAGTVGCSCRGMVLKPTFAALECEGDRRCHDTVKRLTIVV